MIIFKVPDLTALQTALEELTNFLTESGISGERVFDSKLVACELLENVLRHTDSQTELQGEIKDGHIELKIFSNVPFETPKKIVCSDVFCEHGRGLFLVNELCEGQIASEIDGIRVKLKIQK